MSSLGKSQCHFPVHDWKATVLTILSTQKFCSWAPTNLLDQLIQSFCLVDWTMRCKACTCRTIISRVHYRPSCAGSPSCERCFWTTMPLWGPFQNALVAWRSCVSCIYSPTNSAVKYPTCWANYESWRGLEWRIMIWEGTFPRKFVGLVRWTNYGPTVGDQCRKCCATAVLPAVLDRSAKQAVVKLAFGACGGDTFRLLYGSRLTWL